MSIKITITRKFRGNVTSEKEYSTLEEVQNHEPDMIASMAAYCNLDSWVEFKAPKLSIRIEKVYVSDPITTEELLDFIRGEES